MSRQQQLIERIKKLSPQKQALLHTRLHQGDVISQQSEKLTLAAFVIPCKKQSITIELLKEALHESLPEYMVPSNFTLLEKFPQLPNGKVDIAALSINQPNSRLKRPGQAIEQELELKLKEIWCKVLQTDFIDIEDNFFEIGGDSILSIQIVSLAHQANLALLLTDLFDFPTIVQLAAQLRLRKAESNKVSSQLLLNTGQAPLTPIHHWFLNQNLIKAEHWNQNRLLEITADLSAEQLNTAIDAISRRHDALRTCFPNNSNAYSQNIAEQITSDFGVIHITQGQDVNTAVDHHASAIQAGFSLQHAPLIKFRLFDCASEPAKRLLICAHHLVIDEISWRILFEDLEISCAQLLSNEAIVLPSTASSYITWSQSIQAIAQTTEIQQELDYWKALPLANSVAIPRDHDGVQSYEGNVDIVSVKLGIEETKALIDEVHSAYRTTVLDLLLTALAQTLYHWTGRKQTTIGLEGHGRETLDKDIDISRTIGWFTSFYPISLEVSSQQTDAAKIIHSKEMRHQIPNRGIGYGLLRYSGVDNETRDTLSAVAEPEILFNYLGNIDSHNNTLTLFQFLPINCEPQRHPSNQRAHLLDINCYMLKDHLVINWHYDRKIHYHKTVASLADDFNATLLQLINHCLNPKSGGYTPSDFPDAGLDQDDLDAFINTLS